MRSQKLALPLLVFLGLAASSAYATQILGTALSSFSVLGGVSVTNTDSPAQIVTTLSGNLGATNIAASGITGFYGALQNSGPGVVDGTVYQGLQDNGMAITANAQLVSAIAALDTLTPTKVIAGGNLTGLTLAPGVYSVSGPATNLAGTLTLDGGGNANATWVFLMSSSLITSTYSNVKVINTGNNSGTGVYWDVASSATLNTGTTFVGNILAQTSITMGSNVSLCGRALAGTGNVTMISDTIGCTGTAAASNNMSGGAMASSVDLPIAFQGDDDGVPEPPTYVMLLTGLLLSGVLIRRRKQRQISAHKKVWI